MNNTATLSLRHLFRPILALAFASLFSCGLVALRIVLTTRISGLYLVWNLFLAWMPLLFALAAVLIAQTRPQRRGLFLGSGSAWLLFFPNAPYILTDLIHLGSKHQGRYWTDLVLILLFALLGLVLGFVSLFLMQRLVTQRHGWPAGWLFVGLVAALSGFGIYAGRFFRWNSWDVVFDPVSIIADLAAWSFSIPSSPRGLVIPALFGTLLFIAYLMLYGLTHLPNPGRASERTE